jgi:hypothetical protein
MTRLARLLVALVLALPLSFVAGPGAPASANDQVGVPVLAYYYIWYTPTSWDRAKSDLPLLGRYSSDEISVMEAHAKEARTAGIDGFLVSWKHTPDLDRRLALLVQAARDNGLKLGIVYEGLDFFRRPLPPKRVAMDLRWFVHKYGHDPVFSIQGRPLVIWAGTWESTPRQIDSVTRQVRGRARILASQRNAEEYAPVAPYVDGDAYYWSSLDPDVDIHAQQDLDELSSVVHDSGGLWIPSVAPGFDARLIGGHRVVPRHSGDTLRQEWKLAVDSSPDAVGIVSWNEFSENSHIEPSQRFGNESLRALASILSAKVPDVIAADSSDPPGGGGFPVRPVALLLVAFGIVIASFGALTRRRVRSGRPSGDAGPVAGGREGPADPEDGDDLEDRADLEGFGLGVGPKRGPRR